MYYTIPFYVCQEGLQTKQRGRTAGSAGFPPGLRFAAVGFGGGRFCFNNFIFSVTLLPFVCIFIRRAKIISGSKRNSENTKLPDNSLEEGAARGSASFSDKWFSVRNNDAAYRGKKAAGENRRAALCIR